MTDSIPEPVWEAVALDWYVLTLRCSECIRVAARLTAPRASTTELEIVATGTWIPVVHPGMDLDTFLFAETTPYPCTCKWLTYPALDSCRREIRRAIGKGLGNSPWGGVTMRRMPSSA
jgi:hypothetical protein